MSLTDSAQLSVPSWLASVEEGTLIQNHTLFLRQPTFLDWARAQIPGPWSQLWRAVMGHPIFRTPTKSANVFPVTTLHLIILCSILRPSPGADPSPLLQMSWLRVPDSGSASCKSQPLTDSSTSPKFFPAPHSYCFKAPNPARAPTP